MKEYSYEDFKVNTYAYKSITDEGRINSYTGRFDINHSDILSRLIQEAGRYCENFASDLFIDWDGVLDYIEHIEGDSTYMTFLFGFRQNGVDHSAFVFNRYDSNGDRARYEYRSIWRLDIRTDEDKITMTLGRVF